MENERLDLIKYKTRIWPFIIIFILGIGLTFCGFYFFKDYFFKGTTTGNGTCYTACENKITVNDKGISSAVSKLYNAVVLIENYQNNKLYSSGTGFIYKVDEKSGYLLTNYHVISKNTSLKVYLYDDRVIDATYLGGDEYLDVAVLKIPKEYVKKVAQIGKSSETLLGDTVFTVGTPVDYEYRGTVTRGILSGKDRLVSIEQTDIVMKVLQTDAAINPGNSGGPLANSNGEVIGINSLKLSSEKIEGMGFAIAIEDVMTHIDSFEKGEKIERPFLGINMVNSNDIKTLYQNGITLNSNIVGVVVTSIVDNSSVINILQPKDIITKINGKKVQSTAYLKYELYKYNPGDKISVTFIRGEKELTKEVILKKNNL